MSRYSQNRESQDIRKPISEDVNSYRSLQAVWNEERFADRKTLYADLCALLKNGQMSEDIYARLYWLCKLWPSLDSSCDACHWLIEGLRICGFNGNLLMLYAIEIENYPDKCLTISFKSLIIHAQQTEYFSRLVWMRWRCAARLEHWDMIIEELPVFRHCVKQTDNTEQTMLLIWATDQLAWSVNNKAREAFESCCAELYELSTDNSELWDGIERFEYCCELSSAWRKLFTLKGPDIGTDYHFFMLVDLIRDSWLHPQRTIRAQYMRCITAFVNYKKHALRALDCLSSVNKITIHYLRSIIADYSCHHGTPRANANMDFITEDFQLFMQRHNKTWSAYIKRSAMNNYEIRLALLQFCLRRSMPPQTIFEHLAASGCDVSDDIALGCLYEAQKMFWN